MAASAKALEHAVDTLSPALSLRLRRLKKRLNHDITLSLIGQLVRPGDEVLDVGAYRGAYTLEMSRRVGEGGRVWALEPFAPSAAALRRAMARTTNVVVCPWAASDREGRAPLTVPVHHGRGLGALATLGSADVSHEVVETELRTIDGLREGTDARRPVTFLRCDVVGHERAVLAGAAETLRVHRPAVLAEIEQRHQRSPVQQTFDMFDALGYEGYFLRRRSLVPLASFDLDRDQVSLVPAGFVPYSMPADYVHYFLFVRPGTDLGGVATAT